MKLEPLRIGIIVASVQAGEVSLGASGHRGDRRRRADRRVDRPGTDGPEAWRRRVIGVGRDPADARAGAERWSDRPRPRPTWRKASPRPTSSSSARRSAGSPTTSAGRPRPRPRARLVTDAGSTKRQIVEAVERHPLGGASSSAPIRSPVRSGRASAHARADLFRRPRLRADPHAPHPARRGWSVPGRSGRPWAAASSR